MAKSVKRKRSGRPDGAPTRYPGIMRFCERHGYSHQHVRLVLDGKRESRRLMVAWFDWRRVIEACNRAS
jgi:hypothetical protein